jgi:Amidase
MACKRSSMTLGSRSAQLPPHRQHFVGSEKSKLPGGADPGCRIVSAHADPESPGEQVGSSGIDADSVTVAGLQQALTSGSLTSADLVAFYLARIDRLNPGLGAVITVSTAAAADALASDVARAAGQVPGPLAGIPVLIKDNVAVRGMPATAGSPALQRLRWPAAPSRASSRRRAVRGRPKSRPAGTAWPARIALASAVACGALSG